jgi:hypothetical protein
VHRGRSGEHLWPHCEHCAAALRGILRCATRHHRIHSPLHDALHVACHLARSTLHDIREHQHRVDGGAFLTLRTHDVHAVLCELGHHRQCDRVRQQRHDGACQALGTGRRAIIDDLLQGAQNLQACCFCRAPDPRWQAVMSALPGSRQLLPVVAWQERCTCSGGLQCERVRIADRAPAYQQTPQKAALPQVTAAWARTMG